MILISPWARKTTDGTPSPKNYPHWDRVVRLLKLNGKKVVQVSVKGEPDVEGCDERKDNLPLKEVDALLQKCETWASSDNFFHHFAWLVKKPGVAIWGMSDPKIFGHPENTNLLLDRKFLRKRQFGLWSQEPPNPLAFVPPEEVVKAILERSGK